VALETQIDVAVLLLGFVIGYFANRIHQIFW
jgi:hypothetical protein